MAKSKKANPLKGFYPGCSVKLRNGDVVKNVYKTAWGDSWALVAARSDIDIEDLRKATCEVRKTNLVVYIHQLAMSWCANGSYTGPERHECDIVGVVPKAKTRTPEPKPKPKNPLKEYYPGCSVKLRDGHVVHNVYRTKSKNPGFRYAAFEKFPDLADLRATSINDGLITRHDDWALAWYSDGKLLNATATSPCDIEEVLPKAEPSKPKPKPKLMTDLIEGYYDGCSVELKDGTVVDNVWHTKCDSCYALTAFKKWPTEQDIEAPDSSKNVKINCGHEDLSWYACGQMWSYAKTDNDIVRVIPAVAVKTKEANSSLSTKVKELEDELAKVKAELAERDRCIDNFVKAIKAR